MWCWRKQGNRQQATGNSEKRSVSVAVLLVTVALFGQTACSSLETTPEVLVREMTSEDLTTLLHEQEKAIQSLKGLFSADVKGPGLPIAQTVYGTILFRRPGLLRLQGFTRFGGKVFDLALNPERFVLQLPKEKKLVSGTPDEWKDQAGFSHTLRLSILAMSGVLGNTGVNPRDHLRLVGENEFYRLEVYAPSQGVGEGPGPIRKIWFGKRSLLVVQEKRFLETGELGETLTLDDYREVRLAPREQKAAGVDVPTTPLMFLPFKVTAEDGHGDGWIEIVFSELAPNVPISDHDLLLVHDGPTRDAK